MNHKPIWSWSHMLNEVSWKMTIPRCYTI